MSLVMSVRPSVRPSACNISAPTGRSFMESDVWVFFENLSRKFKFHSNRTRINGTLGEDQCTFMIISLSVLLKMRNVLNKSCRKNQNTHFCSIFFFFENCGVYEIMWKNIVKSDKLPMTICRMRFVRRIPKAINTHSEYVILLFHNNNGYTNAPQCYVVRTLPVLFNEWTDWRLVNILEIIIGDLE
jgi:hypothetical protein